MTKIILNTADAQQDGLIPDFTSSGIGSLQEFFNGDKSIAAMVRPVIPSTDGNALFPWEADYVSTDVIYFQIGEENAKATGGTFTLTYGAGTTSALAYNVTAAALETALEALSTGGVTVTLLSDGVYQVDWNSVGVIAPPITSDADLLQPACEIIVTVTNVGSASEKEQRVIEIRQAPVVSSTIDTVFTPTGVSATQKSANSATQNAIYEINLGDAYAGEYTVSLTANGVTTIVVLSAEMESDAIGIALAAHPEIYYQDVTEPDNIAVSKNGALITVQFIGTLGGTQSVRTITGASSIAVGNPTVITSTAHKLKTGDSIVVSGSDSTPTIDGTRTVTVISENSFSVPVNVTVAGTTGSFYATTQPAIAYGSDLSLKTPKGFTGTINLNTVALAKAFWATEADELTYPAQFKRVRVSGEERIIYGSTVTLKRQLINGGVVVPEIAEGTLVIADGKTFTVNNTLTLAGTDGTTHTFPTTSATLARTDASQTFTGDQFFSDSVIAIIGLSVGSASAIDGQIRIFNETNSFYVSINASNATVGNQTWVFPDLLGSTDVFVGRDLAQTLTNKTISGASNTITNVSLTTGVTGTLPSANGGTGSTTWGQLAIFWDQKANSVSGDAISANTWTKVTLNTEHCDTGSAFSVSSSVITVAVGGGGVYRVRFAVPLYVTSSAVTRLRRTNNTATTLVVGGSEYTWNSNYVTSKSEITARVTLTAGDTLELQCFAQTAGSIGYASAGLTDGEVRVYSIIEFTRE